MAHEIAEWAKLVVANFLGVGQPDDCQRCTSTYPVAGFGDRVRSQCVRATSGGHSLTVQG
jgi:hypothetical protein